MSVIKDYERRMGRCCRTSIQDQHIGKMIMTAASVGIDDRMQLRTLHDLR